MRGLAMAIAFGLALASSASARAGDDGELPDELADELAVAAEAFKEGEFARAAKLAGALARRLGGARRHEVQADQARQDRAEAWRIFGLALFFDGEHERAEAALLEYLKLDADAHLDPALVPPEAIVFLEDVRSRHVDEIRAYHPEPEPRRWRVLNLAPPAGQFQNGDRRKGWTLAASGAVLVGLNIGTYAVLRYSWCDRDSHVCGEGGERYRRARTVRALNVASAVGLGALYVYGVYDGFSGSRTRDRERSVSIAPAAGPPGIALIGRF